MKDVIFGSVIKERQKGDYENGRSHVRRILESGVIVNLLSRLSLPANRKERRRWVQRKDAKTQSSDGGKGA